MSRQRQTYAHRPRLALVAGLLALFLQLLAPVLPPAAMAGAMDLAAASPEEAASFAATCLGTGDLDLDPGSEHSGIDHQAKCPICLSVAQGQGFAPATASMVTTINWVSVEQLLPADAAPVALATSAFASRAPPAA